MSLRDYLDSFHSAVSKIEDFGFSESIDIKMVIRPSKQAVCKARIVLVDGSVLQIREYIDAKYKREYIDAKYKTEKVNYAYHYQDKDGKLIFRYDNAQHRPALEFIDHKHVSDDTITEFVEPDLADVIDEVISYL
jgi:hypothetical protein